MQILYHATLDTANATQDTNQKKQSSFNDTIWKKLIICSWRSATWVSWTNNFESIKKKTTQICFIPKV